MIADDKRICDHGRVRRLGVYGCDALWRSSERRAAVLKGYL